jgi:hypothetical protein
MCVCCCACRWVAVNIVAQTLSYFGENPRRALALYDVVEEAKGVINLAGATTETLTGKLQGAPTQYAFKLRTPERESVFAVRCVVDVRRHGACDVTS